MIKTWEQRMPARLPESMIDCAMMQISCMAEESNELHAEIVRLTPPAKGLFLDLIAQHEGLAEELAAQTVPAYVPLTDKAIMKVWNTKVGTLDESGKWLLTYARAIERAVRGVK